MNSVQTQTLSIKGDGGGEAYIDFCDGQLCVSVLIEGKQADFHFEPVTLKMFAHAYKLHCEVCCRNKINQHKGYKWMFLSDYEAQFNKSKNS